VYEYITVKFFKNKLSHFELILFTITIQFFSFSNLKKNEFNLILRRTSIFKLLIIQVHKKKIPNAGMETILLYFESLKNGSFFRSRLKIYSGQSYFDMRFVFSDTKYIRIARSPLIEYFFFWACVIITYRYKFI